MLSITAGPDYPTITTAIVIGAIGGMLCTLAIPLFDKVKIDDPVGALSVHLVAGVWGTLAVGIFGDASLLTQIMGVLIIGAFTFISSFIVWKTIQLVVGLRVSLEDETQGIDLSEFGLTAYSMNHRDTELSTI